MSELEKARQDLAWLEAQLPPNAHLFEPFTRLFNAIAAVRNRIARLEARRLPTTGTPQEPV